MITSKQRSFLRGLAHELEPTVYIGKAGMTDNIVKEMNTGLEIRELVKVKLQEGCELTPRNAANELAELLKAEYVQAIGRKFTLYRESKDHKQIELPRDSNVRNKDSKAK
ncbi:MAG TPA: ribosome assembly RNA-binding protein YhbY [Anaerovoracaceae bacterium]|nr:ribosome assembly RNA-binding protein YhbY [Anaerovoracaceae bacterium]